MKNYQLNLKGSKKNQTKDISIIIHGDNKSQAFYWAFKFFQNGEFTEPYFATGSNSECGGTLEFIPQVNEMMIFSGKYKVYSTSVVCIK